MQGRTRKILIGTILIILLLISGITLMMIYEICPPKGPWMAPPWCENYAEIPRISSGEVTNAGFWVSVPSISRSDEEIRLVIEGRSPTVMVPIGEYAWKTSVPAVGQERLSYYYTSSAGRSRTFERQIRVPDHVTYDSVPGWSEEPFTPSFPQGFLAGIHMQDTWGKNYNFMMFEDTRKNIESTFDRLEQIGLTEVVVYDFYDAHWVNQPNKYAFDRVIPRVYQDPPEDWVTSTEWEIVPGTFWDDHRDEAMSQADLNRIAHAAHARNLRAVWSMNFAFTSIGTYIGADSIWEASSADFAALFEVERTPGWIDDYFTKYEALMLNRADALNEAGFDVMIITPGWHNPNFSPEEELANLRMKQMIARVKERFNGDVAVVIDLAGFLEADGLREDWSTYDYYTEADSVIIKIYSIRTGLETLAEFRGTMRPDAYEITDPSVEEMKALIDPVFDLIEEEAKRKGVDISIAFGVSAFKDAAITDAMTVFAMDPTMAIEDTFNQRYGLPDPDYAHQADAYEAWWQAAEGRERIVRMMAMGYSWDDAVNERSPARLDLGSTIRNRPAEGVMQKWALAVR
ncbi:MAG: hypothetical protein Q7J09_05690 [Methanocalculus sp.]|uniref:hypothetical protein n=1 Tax=Methanocalculus sp. TaxID=2004547 RepID=UPI002724D4C2|nr:hypothetical protein [Methanocalculus sp.]MDO9539479.1 hypothetical protein [Methanocalculus sp.]